MPPSAPHPRPRVRAAALAAGVAGRPGWRADIRHHAGLVLRWCAAASRTEQERRRLFNWLPVPFGIGIILYFSADREPAAWAPATGLCLAATLAVVLRRRPPAAVLLIALAALFAGFGAATWRTARVAAPILDRIQVGALSGFVESVDPRPGGARLVILTTSFAGLDEAHRPRRVRVGVNATSLKPGDHVLATARLLPPPGPPRPGGYDFGRDAFFRGIGAVGSIAGRIALSPPPAARPDWLDLRVGLEQARNALTERIASAADGQAGAMAAALVTGKRGLISEDTNSDLRAAGIYHIISISGLHMVLAAGTIFWLVRALLALSRTLALAWPIKKIAALAAMAGATAYCVFSGAEVATVRSLIMTLVMLGAILVDRTALSLRNLAIAALIVLAREPDALLGPSFQMSFGAVAALIAFAERWRARPVDPVPVGNLFLYKLRLACSGVVLTTLIASAATAPFGAYHFQTFNPFGLLGNAMALPFVSLFVMPAAVVGLLAYPFGLDAPAWIVMGWASSFVLMVADGVAGLDGSTLVVPAFGAAALGLFAFALLWLCLWTTALRHLAIVPLVAGLALAVRPNLPDILIERDGSGLLARDAGRLFVIGRPSRFVLEQWLTSLGDQRKADDPSLRQGAACDPLGCVLRLADGRTIAHGRERLALTEDCGRADLVVTPLAWHAPCRAHLVDRRALDRGGATMLRANAEGWTALTSLDPRAERPWLRKRPEPPQPAPASPAPAIDPPEADAQD